MKIDTVYVIFLQFTSQHLASAREVMYKKVLTKIEYNRLVWVTVDNSISLDLEMTKSSGYHFISGDNSSREFSGFDKGVQLLTRLNPRQEDMVVLANDTFHRSYGDSYLDSLSREKIQTALDSSGVCGYVDSFPKSVRGFGREFSSWIRTSFLIVSYSTLTRILPFALPNDRQLIFGKHVDEFFKSNDLLSDNYKQYIKTWLFDSPPDESEFKESWHSKSPLNEGNFKDMQDKAWCILCEQNLGARTVENKIPIIRIND